MLVNGPFAAGHPYEVPGNQLRCVLEMQNCYDIENAYSASVHVAFLRVRTDEDLIKFTKRWGPLHVFKQDRQEIILPVAWFWSRQRTLSAFISLIDAIKSREREKDALIEYANAKSEDDKLRLPYVGGESFSASFRRFFPVSESDISGSIRNAELNSVRQAAISEIQIISIPCKACFEVLVARKPEVIARWKIDTLEDALQWMVWRDFARGQPVSYCRECGSAFIPESKHPRKYCSPDCGHKVAARKWAKDKRAENKRSRRRKAG
jgi:hypothetical protein